MKEICVESFAKINLSIDVGETMENGYHQVDMIMQQISFHDDVIIRWIKDKKRRHGDIAIILTTNRYYLPCDNRNLAYKAADLMIERYGKNLPGGRIEIDILKRIPVSAGLAGGSGNGAAVIHGLNKLFNLNLKLKTLMNIGKELGSDVPFCIMGQAKSSKSLDWNLRVDKMARCASRATGTGTELKPVPGIKAFVVLAKPPIGVSTKEVYAGIDKCQIRRRPDNNALEKHLREGRTDKVIENMVNVLENYTLKRYPEISKIKEILEKETAAFKVLMSGSGPTVFALYKKIEDAQDASKLMRNLKYEAYWTKTIK